MTDLNQLSSQISFAQVNFNQILSQYGFMDFVLPFLLIFSIVFMLLELSNLLKVSPDDAVGRKLSALFSLGFALLSIYNQDLLKWLLSFIPKATIAIIGFSLLVIALALTNRKVPSGLRAFFAFIVVGIILWLAINSLSITESSTASASPLISLLSYELNYLIQSGMLALLIIFGLIFLVIVWVVGGEKKREEKEEKIRGPILLRSR
jgi:cbb3-type cytochrome oxidase subunit 3